MTESEMDGWAIRHAVYMRKVRESIEGLPNGRARSIALTKLDECEMWLQRSLEELSQAAGEGRP